MLSASYTLALGERKSKECKNRVPAWKSFPAREENRPILSNFQREGGNDLFHKSEGKLREVE